MYRLIILGLIGFGLGAIVGPYFALAGLAVGALIAGGWLMITGVGHDVGPAVLEKHTERVLCVPRASIAECDMTRDAQTGRWLNIERCSICSPESNVDCEKRCLIVMNDTVRRPGRWQQGARSAA
jgi:hypothetical protein